MTRLPLRSPRLSLALSAVVATAGLFAGTSAALAHGDVSPQPVDTATLPEIGDDWLIENPYRALGDEVWAEAIRIGSSGYNQNCARCHGLEVISGGLAPDLRFLEAEEYGDEWYMERFRIGYTQNGTTKMPAFEEVLGQKAGWAIRTYIETRPDTDMQEEFVPQLKTIRDTLLELDDAGTVADGIDGMKEQLAVIATQIETLSGAPVADSIAYRASNILVASDPSTYGHAAETLTVGLSVAH